MSSTIYKAVCARLQQVDFTTRINVCCLCLETVGDSGACVDDEVVIDPRGRPFHSLKLANMLKVLMDESFAEVMFILKAVCKPCVSSAVTSYKFIQNCKENVKKIIKVVDNIEESLDRLVLDDNVKSLYVAIQPAKNATAMVKRFYDTRRLLVPEDTAFLRFSQIAESQIDPPEGASQDDIEEAFEQTVNVNKVDETVQALMCCKSVVDTQELLDNPDKPNEYKCRICKKNYDKSTSLRVHFFRVHRVKDFKCDKCKTAIDKADTIRQYRPTVINKNKTMSRSKITNLETIVQLNEGLQDTLNTQKTIVQLNKDLPESHNTGGTIVQLNDDSLECIEEERQFEDNINENDEGNPSENEEQKANPITLVPTESLLQNKHHRKVPSPITFYLEQNYISEINIITENSCNNCGMNFSTRARYLSHKMKFKNNDCRGRKGGGNFKCNFCNFTSFYKRHIRNHIEYKHMGVKDYHCSYCNKNCCSKGELVVHLRKHTGERPYQCYDCGKKFADASNLKHHEYIHTGELPYPCEFCNKAFRTGTLRIEHVARYHKPHAHRCPICGDVFKVKQDLKNHEMRHYATRPVKNKNK